jgi:Flp pilus assembly protein TadG
MAERERGSVLLLMPAAVLVFLVLGALTVDFGGAYAARRQLEEAAAAAANDAATRALDLDVLYGEHQAHLVGADALRVVQASVAAKGLDRLHAEVRQVVVSADGLEVTVTVGGRAPFVFGRALPGRRDGMAVEAKASARLARDGG